MAEKMEEAKVKSLYKALKLLDYFVNPPYEWGVTEIAVKANLPKSSVYNIFSTFVQYGMLEYNDSTKKYYLGYKTAELGSRFKQNNSLVSVMRPLIEALSEETKECVYLGKLMDNSVLYLDVVYPQSSMGGNIVGTKAPLYCTGIGKALLSQADNRLINQVISSPLKPYTPDTICDQEQLLMEINRIRKLGYAVDNMEHEFGVKCVAVPLLNNNDVLVGAISISGPSLRFPETKIQEYAQKLLEISRTVRKYI